MSLLGDCTHPSRPRSQLAGRCVSLSSPQDVSKLLYQDLALKLPSCSKKTKTGMYRCRRAELLDMRQSHAVVPLILEYRSLEKHLGLLQVRLWASGHEPPFTSWLAWASPLPPTVPMQHQCKCRALPFSSLLTLLSAPAGPH